MAWKLTEVFASNILLGKGQFHNKTRDGGFGFDEVGFIILQLEVQVELYENVSQVSNMRLDGCKLFC